MNRTQWTLGRTLGVGFALIVGALIVVALVGNVALRRSDAALSSIYHDRTQPLQQLGAVNHLMALQRIVLTDAAFDRDAANTSKRLEEYAANHARIEKEWKAYMATTLTPQEKELTIKVEEARRQLTTQGFDPLIAALRAQDYDRAVAALDAKLGRLGPVFVDLMDKLIQLQVDVAAEEFNAAIGFGERMEWLGLVLSVAGLAIGVGAAVLIPRRVLRRLGAEPAELAEAADRVARGELDVAREQPAPPGSVLASMQAMRRSLVEIVGQVRSGSDSIATASAQIAQGNQDLSGRTEQQASALQQTASSMEQLGSTVRQNADNARQANQLAQNASTVAARGGEVVAQVVETMKGINDSSRRIADIITVIDGIAFQTNILALNAAVEAARAGEQGRGFAVVAGEVRNLAQRSAEAAREIKGLITASVERVEHGSTLVDRAGATMHEVVTAIQRVSDIMAEISAASAEQSQGVSQVGEAVSQMDHVTQQNAALVEESAAAAESMRQQAQALVQAVAAFRLAQGAGGAAAFPAEGAHRL